jgi:hypothetical protein
VCRPSVDQTWSTIRKAASGQCVQSYLHEPNSSLSHGDSINKIGSTLAHSLAHFHQ